MSHVVNYFTKVAELTKQIDLSKISKLAGALKELRENKGRLFILGVGGSAANASHAVNDFRKLCKIETYSPTDNVSELTARTNDEGWNTVFVEWLKVSNICEKDAILVLSVGGGNEEKQVSVGLIHALKEAKQKNAKVYGILGKDGGYTAQIADIAVVIPPIDDSLITPLSEAYQAVVWHCLVSDPELQLISTKW
jgi:D-sedoheptulose 7-phosphate isomerase